MVEIKDLLEEGEYPIERYRVKVTELIDSGWAVNIPWWRAFITNRRLILIPEATKQCSPTIIPLNDIVHVWNVGLGRLDGVVFSLTNGERLHMIVDWNQGRRFTRDTLRVLEAPPESGKNYLL
jgi:hypothetical protein